MTGQISQARRNRGPLILSAATASTPRNWSLPIDTSREFTRDLNQSIEFAKLAEKAKFHNVFFVDHLTWFDVYGDSHEGSAKYGVNAPRIDPSLLVSALASHTKSIGFITTLSTISEHPYHFARRLASLDHLSDGRAGWNIVASYLPSVGKNLLDGAPIPEHSERYVKTEEYLDAVYELLLSSWRDDALVYDKKKGIFADPEAIREINHEGKYFSIKGPAITEPTKQRFPLVVQAGSSEKGIEFAAENAELVFIDTKSTDKIPEIRKLAETRFNRDPYSIKFITSLLPFIGNTHQEALDKFEEYKKAENLEANLVFFGGISGFDLSKYGWDEEVGDQGESNAIKSITKTVLNGDKGGQTKTDIAKKYGTRLSFAGTASEVADQIEDLLSKADIDGFNFIVSPYPGMLIDIVELLVPELQRRGLAQTEYSVPGGTLRENFYGEEGKTFLSGDHPAYNLRWRKGVSKEQFEKELSLYKALRNERRAYNIGKSEK